MAHSLPTRLLRDHPLARLWQAVKQARRATRDPVNDLPLGLSPQHLRDIGLSSNQIYRYQLRGKPADRF